MKIVRFALVVLVAAVGLTHSIACNTTEGAGRDMERAGEKVQDVANDAKN